MIRRFSILVAGLALAIGAVVLTGSPASAHNFDGNSLYTCSQEEPPDGTPDPVWVTRHSHPVALTEAYVDYSCCAWDGAREVRYWATLWWNGATNAHGGYRYGVLGTDCF